MAKKSKVEALPDDDVKAAHALMIEAEEKAEASAKTAAADAEAAKQAAKAFRNAEAGYAAAQVEAQR